MIVSVVENTENSDQNAGPLGLRHAVQVLATPRSVFERAEDTGAYGWALMTLLVLVFLIGHAEVQTGLINRGVDLKTEKGLAKLEKEQGHLLDRVELRDRMVGIRKTGEFNKMLSRVGVMVFSPVYFLSSFLLISAGMYAVVALTGRKPEFHTLMSICVYAGMVEVVSLIVRLAMVLYYRTAYVDTSFVMLAETGSGTWLAAVDPFRIWFWVLVGLGLIVTRQLSRRMAVVTCLLMALVAGGARVGFTFAAASAAGAAS
ncbi:MAG: YIP1 family protein [Planctomycetes bacterium]|nr:YIP1 family protein [Planctomycetota bacterium]